MIIFIIVFSAILFFYIITKYEQYFTNSVHNKKHKQKIFLNSLKNKISEIQSKNKLSKKEKQYLNLLNNYLQ